MPIITIGIFIRSFINVIDNRVCQMKLVPMSLESGNHYMQNKQ